MPEGDTIFRAAGRLHAALAGQEITRFDIRVPRSATADLTGEMVREVVPRGKHLLLRAGGFTLHSHLRMDGEWVVLRPGGRWPRAAFRARAVVAVARAEAVGFDLAMVEVLPTADEARVVGHLGPDLLGPDWDAAEAARRLSADDRAAHVAILDQRSLAGLGNVFANEVLFVRGIDPSRPLRAEEIPPLIDTAHRMIVANRDRSARTFTGDSRPGQRTWVYGRDGKACRRCGTLIGKTELGASETEERVVYSCPHCQS